MVAVLSEPVKGATAPAVSWPSWLWLAPSLAPDVLVVGPELPEGCAATGVACLTDAPAGPWTGVLLADACAADLRQAAGMVRSKGWVCAGVRGAVRIPRGFETVERHIPLPHHRRTVTTIPVTRHGSRLLTSTLFLAYAPPGRARRVRRTAMLALPSLLSLVPVRVLAALAPSRVVLFRRCS